MTKTYTLPNMKMTPRGRRPAPGQMDAAQMIAAADRDLRTPLATLAAASRMLTEDLGAEHRCAGYARLIRQESLRIHETLEDMTRLTAPLNLRRDTVDVAQLLHAVIARVGAQAPRVRFMAQVPTASARVCGDAEALETAILRLLQYQASALPCGGEVCASLSSRAGWVHLRVSDSGPATPSELLSRAFEPFADLPGRHASLAPAVCRRIVEGLGGAVAARCGAGLTIEIQLPVLG